jgi:hypothetical protein
VSRDLAEPDTATSRPCRCPGAHCPRGVGVCRLGLRARSSAAMALDPCLDTRWDRCAPCLLRDSQVRHESHRSPGRQCGRCGSRHLLGPHTRFGWTPPCRRWGPRLGLSATTEPFDRIRHRVTAGHRFRRPTRGQSQPASRSTRPSSTGDPLVAMSDRSTGAPCVLHAALVRSSYQSCHCLRRRGSSSPLSALERACS